MFCSVGWLSGQKQRSVKPSGYALHRFESYSYHHLTTLTGGFFIREKRNTNCLVFRQDEKAGALYEFENIGRKASIAKRGPDSACWRVGICCCIVVSKKCYRGMRTKRQIPDYCDGANNHYNRKQTPRGFFPRGVWL